jgi:hypothetical protein
LTIEHFQESVFGINLTAMGGIGVRPRPGGVQGLERGTVPQSSKASPDPIAVAPDGIEQQCEVTIKEGMLNETILINGSGQARHYHGKFECAPWLSK